MEDITRIHNPAPGLTHFPMAKTGKEPAGRAELQAAVKHLGDAAAFARRFSYNKADTARLYRALTSGKGAVGYDLVRDAFTVLKEARDPLALPHNGITLWTATPAEGEGEAVDVNPPPKEEPAILFGLDSGKGPAVGYDVNLGRFVKLGDFGVLPLGLLSSVPAGDEQGTSGAAS